MLFKKKEAPKMGQKFVKLSVEKAEGFELGLRMAGFEKSSTHKKVLREIPWGYRGFVVDLDEKIYYIVIGV